MKILVLNGSPKGKYSITLQTVLYLQKKFKDCEFEVLHVGQTIKALEKEFSKAVEAIEAADVVIMTDEPSRIALAMQISRKTLASVKQNIVFAIGVKVFVLLLAAVGIANMWLAVFADVGVAVLAILNAMLAMKVPS